MKWISISEQVPTYYKLVLCCTQNESLAVCWRANTGDYDIYTIAGTDNILENIVYWMELPKPPTQ